jgi:hypothetical protein
MIERGELEAIVINGRVKITHEAVLAAERGPLAARKPPRRRKRQKIDPEVAQYIGLP